MTAFNEYGRLRRVLVGRPHDFFAGPDRIAEQWQGLNFSAAPDLERALAQFDTFEAALRDAGAHVDHLAAADALTLDAIYVRDASIVTPRGVVLCRMGKPARRGEPTAQARALTSLAVPLAGFIEPPGLIEGGDVVWFDEQTMAVGRGYRTNDEGIRQLRALAGPGIELHVVPLPHFRGPQDVFHLMSIISPVDRDLAVVYSPLMPVPFREWLTDRGVRFVEVPDQEFDSLGANVLAIGPRQCLLAKGNPITRARLEAVGAEVMTYDASEISVKGGGGPTCLTRPLERDSS